MSIQSASLSRPVCGVETFEQAFQDASARPVTEIVPASAGDGLAAFGFALGWLRGARSDDLTLIAAPDEVSAEIGSLYAPGLSQFGLDPARTFHVRTRNLKEALWASEQALGLARSRVLCLVARNARLTLTATRRLHLAAEKNGARCVLLRFDPLSPTAAWTRWSVETAPSVSAARELGRPRFAVSLARRRGGQTGQRWLLEWNAHEHAFNDANAVAGLVAALPLHRPVETHWRHAG